MIKSFFFFNNTMWYNNNVKIHQQINFSTGRDLADACDKQNHTYLNKLKHEDITIEFYPGGFGNNCD